MRVPVTPVASRPRSQPPSPRPASSPTFTERSSHWGQIWRVRPEIFSASRTEVGGISPTKLTGTFRPGKDRITTAKSLRSSFSVLVNFCEVSGPLVEGAQHPPDRLLLVQQPGGDLENNEFEACTLPGEVPPQAQPRRGEDDPTQTREVAGGIWLSCNR